MSKFFYAIYRSSLWVSRKVFSLGYKIDSLTNTAHRLAQRWEHKKH
jgi:hypothetical protein